MAHYDALIIGAGFAGAVTARRLAEDGGKRVPTNYQEILDNYGNEMNSEVGYEVLYQKVQNFLNDNAVESES